MATRAASASVNAELTNLQAAFSVGSTVSYEGEVARLRRLRRRRPELAGIPVEELVAVRAYADGRVDGPGRCPGLITAGLAKLPLCHGDVVCDMGPLTSGSDRRFRPGQVVAAPLGASADESVSVPAGGGRFELRIASKTGRRVEALADGLGDPSFPARRAEVVFAPGTRFRVTDREDGLRVWMPPTAEGAEGGWETKTVVYLEEV